MQSFFFGIGVITCTVAAALMPAVIIVYVSNMWKKKKAKNEQKYEYWRTLSDHYEARCGRLMTENSDLKDQICDLERELAARKAGEPYR